MIIYTHFYKRHFVEEFYLLSYIARFDILRFTLFSQKGKTELYCIILCIHEPRVPVFYGQTNNLYKYVHINHNMKLINTNNTKKIASGLHTPQVRNL